MMNYLWAGMMMIGIVYAACTGRLPDITTAAIDSSKDAVSLCITMLGVMSFWMGFMEIATRAGIMAAATKKMRPVMRFLFPHIPEGHRAYADIITNIIANVLGLGWAATPAGLKAMEGLAELEAERNAKPGRARSANDSRLSGSKRQPLGVASDEMCTFLVLNISSLQLIPVNIIAYRSQYGSVSPTVIVGPAIVATAVSTAVAVVFCKVMCGERKCTRNR